VKKTMGRKATYIVLKNEDREWLTTLVKTGAHKSRQIQRAQILLLNDKGQDIKSIMAILDICRPNVSYILSDYRKKGLSAALYKAFPPDEARQLVKRLEFHFTPKHGSWLNMAEIEFAALSIQCLDRRIPNKESFIKEVKAWEMNRNNKAVKINWSFTSDLAQQKLARHYCNVYNNY
jgi:transposase